MEWVETTGRTVADATERAVDLLGVDESDAEVVILAQPVRRFFGLMAVPARVRVRVRPSRPRPKLDRRDRRRRSGRDRSEVAAADTDDVASLSPTGDRTPGERSAGPGRPATTRSRRRRGRSPGEREPAEVGIDTDLDTGPLASDEVDELDPESGNGPGGSAGAVASHVTAHSDRVDAHRYDDSDDEGEDDMDREGTIDKDRAADFLVGLAECIGAGATAKVIETEDAIEVELDGDDLGLLIGPRGLTLQAVQDLTRAVAQRGLPHQRLRVDVGGYRKRRAEALSRFAAQIAAEVVASGTAKALEPMASPDRKVVHDTVSVIDGVQSTSEGEDPNRRVVISPA